MKKKKIEPCIIVSREGMQGVVSQYVDAQLRLAEVNLQMEQEISAIRDRYQSEIDDVTREIATREAGLFVWAQKHPEEFGEKKSIDLAQAVIGFRTCPPRVEKVKSRDNWGAIAQRIMSINEPAFNGEAYVRYGDPEVAKDALLRDRKEIPEEILKQVGIRFEQDEDFYITPKSEVIEGGVREAVAA